ncbi:MAG: DegT/DnrJ/EryC1/StrS family aminotransferase [Pseudomonadota bacterium]
MPETDAWLPYLAETKDQNWHSNFGPITRKLEARLMEKYGSAGEAFVTASSATSALSAALIAHRVSGHVPCPAFTFQATAGAILGAACQPFIMDVDPCTGTTTAETLAAALDETGAKAAYVVAPYGVTRDFRDHAQVCRDRGARLIIDNAAGLGVARGTDIGMELGHDVDEIFSLHTTKVFGVGEGGLIITHPDHVNAVKAAMNFGISAPATVPRSDQPYWGINGKMSEVAAAVGLAVADTIDDRIAARQKMAAEWMAALDDFRDLIYCLDVSAGPWQCFPIIMPDKQSSLALLAAMSAQDIELRRYYAPSLGDYPDYAQMDACTNSKDLSDRAAILPMRSFMPEGDRNRLMETVYAGLKQVMGS